MNNTEELKTNKNNQARPVEDEPQMSKSDKDKASAAQAEEIKELQAALAAATDETAELKDKYLRAAADMENLRRRMERERAEIVKYSLEGVVRELLPVLDSFETALASISNTKVTTQENDGASISQSVQAQEAAIVSGIEMVKKQFVAVLNKHGLEMVKALGESFDPNVHQAIQRLECDDIESEIVHQVFAEGYTLHGRLLRPAMVCVAVPLNPQE